MKDFILRSNLYQFISIGFAKSQLFAENVPCYRNLIPYKIYFAYGKAKIMFFLIRFSSPRFVANNIFHSKNTKSHTANFSHVTRLIISQTYFIKQFVTCWRNSIRKFRYNIENTHPFCSHQFNMRPYLVGLEMNVGCRDWYTLRDLVSPWPIYDHRG